MASDKYEDPTAPKMKSILTISGSHTGNNAIRGTGTDETNTLSLKQCVDNLNNLILQLKEEGYTLKISQNERSGTTAHGLVQIDSFIKKLI